MPIPDFQTLMLPVLRQLADAKEHSSVALRDALAREFNLTADDLADLLPSKRQGKFMNRVAWALSYLKQAILVESPSRGDYKITKTGVELLANPPERITIAYLMRYPEFADFRTRVGGSDKSSSAGSSQEALALPPDEAMADAYRQLTSDLRAELQQLVASMDAYRFEQLVVDLLMAMGYGIEGHVTKRAGDSGIDGVINQDRLGLDVVYVQAKRWANPVGRPEVQGFVGALEGMKATRGILIAAGPIASTARDYVKELRTKVVLIDGQRLAELMIEHDVAVTTRETYRVKKVDHDYFEE